ncbi:MAG: hypothetical protein AAGC53_10855 [Actinomycetota bacterium]
MSIAFDLTSMFLEGGGAAGRSTERTGVADATNPCKGADDG